MFKAEVKKRGGRDCIQENYWVTKLEFEFAELTHLYEIKRGVYEITS